MPIEQVFPVPIYHDDVKDIADVQRELFECYHNVEKDLVKFNLPWLPSNTRLVTNPRENVIEKYNLSHIKAAIDTHLKEYVPEFFRDKEYKIMESWFTRTLPGELTSLHHHGGFDVVGVYYMQTTGDDGSIMFFNHGKLATDYVFGKYHIKDSFSITPKVGKILFFPGWVEHLVDENRTGEVRIGTAFNISYQR